MFSSPSWLGAGGFTVYQKGRQAGYDAAMAAMAVNAQANPVVAQAPAAVPIQAPAADARPASEPGTAAVITPNTPTTPLEQAPAARNTLPTAPPAARAIDAAPVNVTYRLSIKPWGEIYVDGVRRGISPPLKTLTLTGGAHTIRIDNPDFPSRRIDVDAGMDTSTRIDHDFE